MEQIHCKLFKQFKHPIAAQTHVNCQIFDSRNNFSTADVPKLSAAAT